MRAILIFWSLVLLTAIIAMAFALTSAFNGLTGFAIADRNEKEGNIPSFRLHTKAMCNNAA